MTLLTVTSALVLRRILQLKDQNSVTIVQTSKEIISWHYGCSSAGKESACNAGDPGLIPGLERFPWRRAWQLTPVFLPGESPWTEEPGGLQSMWSQRVGHNWATKHNTVTRLQGWLEQGAQQDLVTPSRPSPSCPNPNFFLWLWWLPSQNTVSWMWQDGCQKFWLNVLTGLSLTVREALSNHSPTNPKSHPDYTA